MEEVKVEFLMQRRANEGEQRAFATFVRCDRVSTWIGQFLEDGLRSDGDGTLK